MSKYFKNTGKSKLIFNLNPKSKRSVLNPKKTLNESNIKVTLYNVYNLI